MTPFFSIVTPVYEPPLFALRDMIASVRAQTFENWELVLVDDCSPSEQTRVVLRDAAKADSRIKVIERSENGHISVASNDGVESARGEFIALLDHDDMLVPHALTRMAKRIAEHDDVDYLYSDEDKVDDDGEYFGRFEKPPWSPERFRGQMYTCHLSVIRTDLVRKVGGFRPGFDGSQDHDLILRISEQARRVVHIPEVLYHWRIVVGSAAGDQNAKPYAWESGRRAVQEHLDRVGVKAIADFGPVPGTYRIERSLDPACRVSIVIPTIGQSAMIWGEKRFLVVEAVRSALAKTDHENLEIVIVYDTPTPPSVLADLQDLVGDKLLPVHFDEPFHFSRKVNLGALASTGDRIVVLNDDVEVRSHRWLENLVAPLDDPEVGMTGAKLFLTDGRIQHAGHSYCDDGYHHPFFGADGIAHGPFNSLVINRECSGVTAACAALRRDTFEDVGGFSEILPVNFNDVDISYKVRHIGQRIVWVANCELFHFESKSRPVGIEGWEHRAATARWGIPDRDPYMPTLAL